MAVKTKYGKWRVRWRRDGRRCSRSFPNKALAEKFEAKTKLKEYDSVIGPAHNSSTFSDFALRWHKEHCVVEKSETQWAGNLGSIRHHLNPALGHIRLAELRKAHLLKLKNELRQKRTAGYGNKLLKPKSINNILALAKKMMATAVDWELIPANPFSNVKPVQMGDQPFAFWNAEERDRFLRFCHQLDPAFYEAVTVACHTGLRLGELAALTRGDLDFERRMVKVHANYNYGLKKTLPRTKNGESKDIPLNEDVLKVLSSRILQSSTALVFERSLLANANKRLKRLCRKVGSKEIRFHDLRHTFASCLVMAGVGTMLTKELMRHKSLAMTMRYAHMHPDYLRGATEVLCKKNSSGPRLGPAEERRPTEISLTY